MNRERDIEFSLVVGGPFHALLGKLRLLDANRLPTASAAVILALIAWLPPALLAGLQRFVDPGYSGSTYFTDHTAYVRFIVAIAIMVISERTAESRLAPIVRQFIHAGLIHPDAEDNYGQVLMAADRRSASALAELVIVVLAFALSVVAGAHTLALGAASWLGTMEGGDVALSWAGWWCQLISAPLFFFLLLRWCWRFCVWDLLLLAVSRLRLRLVAFHPDRAGGLGFLSIYPTVFSGLNFAISCVVASSLVRESIMGTLNLEQLRFSVIAWLVLSLILFVGPLLVFWPPLRALREKSIYALGKLASEHQREYETKWLSGSAEGRELLGSQDTSSAADLISVAASPYNLRLIPVSRAEIVQVVVMAGLPMLAAVATKVPLVDLLKRIASALT